MSPTPAQTLETLRQLARSGELAVFCAEHGIDLLVCVGTVVDVERASSARALDVAVLLDPATRADAPRAAQALADLFGYDAVDVVDLGRADPMAQEETLVGGVPLYERVPGTLTAIRERARLLRIDTDRLRGLGLELIESR